jgi:hypothetical protein
MGAVQRRRECECFYFLTLLDASVKGTSYFGQMHVTGNDSIENI